MLLSFPTPAKGSRMSPSLRKGTIFSSMASENLAGCLTPFISKFPFQRSLLHKRYNKTFKIFQSHHNQRVVVSITCALHNPNRDIVLAFAARSSFTSVFQHEREGRARHVLHFYRPSRRVLAIILPYFSIAVISTSPRTSEPFADSALECFPSFV